MTALELPLPADESDDFFGTRPAPKTIGEGLAEAERIINRTHAEEGPIQRTFLLLSGGDDSMVLYDVARRFADDIVHINTGIGVPETNQFVRDLVGPDLIELHPPIAYDDLVLGRWRGFPGPGGHVFAYTMLKERCVRQLLRDHRTKRGQRFALLTGARAGESQRRMGTTSAIRRDGGQVWVNPVLRWSNDLMAEYRATYDLPVNDVTRHLHMSGECLCGAFAKPGEIEELRFFYPHVAERIEALEAQARDAGITAAKWGERPPKKPKPIVVHHKDGTTQTFQPTQVAAGPLCTSCTLWVDEEGEETTDAERTD